VPQAIGDPLFLKSNKSMKPIPKRLSLSRELRRGIDPLNSTQIARVEQNRLQQRCRPSLQISSRLDDRLLPPGQVRSRQLA
jgi:hypothetical protein